MFLNKYPYDVIGTQEKKIAPGPAHSLGGPATWLLNRSDLEIESDKSRQVSSNNSLLPSLHC